MFCYKSIFMVKVQPQKYTILIAFLYCDIYRLFSYNVKVGEEGGINKSATQCDYRGRWYYGMQVDLNQTHFQPLCCVSKVGDETEQRYYTLSTLNIALLRRDTISFVVVIVPTTSCVMWLWRNVDVEEIPLLILQLHCIKSQVWRRRKEQ